ncbi:low-specificity L-threonine aldolase [Dethiobacter alkaliphilus]|uniref:Threonine aldolase n=1 Tax=Dethiobacter alkaliphilus AHT 1 TaxID=555088 RepID=C0GH65_DETAL|nr:Threonine aldolase [Dethiobacter alkaliphilus AHT 1]
MKIIDLRSDTVTKPTKAMRQAMMDAEVGDDVYGEDPTVNRLEEKSAELMGKEAALFVPTGSMGNQLALMVHCERGQEVICDADAHVFHYEMAAAGILSGVQLYPVTDLHNENGLGVLIDHIRPPLSYLPQTRLICLENTLNRGGGSVMPLEQMAVVYRLAREYKLKVHLDGARIFNAATALQCDVTDLSGYADSVMFCLSKGLGAPVGSILAGKNEFIEQARRYRKLLGGGMRQAGVLAAAGLVALDDIAQLSDDHENAVRLAEGLAKIEGLSVDLSKVQTNMVMAEIQELSVQEFLDRILEAGVAAGPMGPGRVRFVTHRDVTAADIDEALMRIGQAL